MTREEELKELKYRDARGVRILKARYGDGFRALCECPTCDKGLGEFDVSDYCPYCGQKLDWSVLDD